MDSGPCACSRRPILVLFVKTGMLLNKLAGTQGLGPIAALSACALLGHATSEQHLWILVHLLHMVASEYESL